MCRQVIFILTVDRCEFGFNAQKAVFIFILSKSISYIVLGRKSALKAK